jgi:hypothetical protein
MRCWTFNIKNKFFMGLEIRKLSTLSYPTFLWKTALVDTKNVLISTYQFSKLSNQSHSVSHYRCSHSLFPIVWLHYSSRFPKATGDALGLVEKQLMLRHQISKGNRRNPLMLSWWNSCTNCLPVPSRATPITIKFHKKYRRFKFKCYPPEEQCVSSHGSTINFS